MNVQESLAYLTDKAHELNIHRLCGFVLNDGKFPVWSGSGKPFQHHYGDGGLAIHTAEVVRLCLLNNAELNANIDERKLFCAALFHDAGKMWDYEQAPWESPDKPPEIPWIGSKHKRHIHHISRSALVWQKACLFYADTSPAMGREFYPSYDWLTPEVEDEILHAILAHHGLREWGSPVAPNTRLAWMLHLCDGISARINDAEKWDHIK